MQKRQFKTVATDLKPNEKEEFEKLLSEISVRHYRLLAGKAVISKDESLLNICIEKLKEKNAPVEGLQNSLNQLVSERRTLRFQKFLIVTFGLLIFIFVGLMLFI